MPHDVTVIKKTFTSITLTAVAKNQVNGPPVTKWMIKCFSNQNEAITKTVYYKEGRFNRQWTSTYGIYL